MVFNLEREIMKKIVMALVLLLMSLSFGCEVSPMQQERWNHEERMAQIKAQGARMSEQDKAQLADMVADRVVKKLEPQTK